MLKESQKAATEMKKMNKSFTFIIGRTVLSKKCHARVGGCVFYREGDL